MRTLLMTLGLIASPFAAEAAEAEASTAPKAAVKKKAAEAPKAAVKKKAAEAPKAAVKKKAAEAPKAAVKKKAAEAPKAAVKKKAAEVPKAAVKKKAAEAPKAAVKKKAAEAPKAAVKKKAAEAPKAAVKKKAAEAPKAAVKKKAAEAPKKAPAAPNAAPGSAPATVEAAPASAEGALAAPAADALVEAAPAAKRLWLMLLAPETDPELATKVQARVLAEVTKWKGHALSESANVTALPADLQVQVQEGCRLRDCRTAALAGLGVDQAVIFEVSSSASSLAMTVFDAQGETLAKVEASCVGCADDEAGLARGVAAIVAEAAAQMAPRSASPSPADAGSAPTAEIEATGGRFAAERMAQGGPLARQRTAVPQGVLRVRKRRKGPTQWKPSKLALGGSAALALGGVTMSVLTLQAYGEYSAAVREERGRGEIDGISSTGKLRQNLAVTAFVLSGAALVTSVILEREAIQ
jgi:hypothetical protein